MNTIYNRQRFSKSNIEEIMTFIEKYPIAPFHSTPLLCRFLTDLVSSDNLVFDLFDGQERVAIASLIDRPKNGANSANLEIVGLRVENDVDSLFSTILSLSKESLPFVRDAVDVSYYESFPVSPSLFVANGFELSYSIYDMVTTSPQLIGVQVMPPLMLSRLTEMDFEEYHSVVMKAFEKNEEANIPPLEDMYPHLLKTIMPPTILKENGRIIGFLYLKIEKDAHESGEINTIGLLPNYRSRGLGKLLLEEALRQLRSHGVKTFKLSVSASNEKALLLYQKFGFEICEKSSVYRWRRKIK